jgi:hypothetical protein
LEIPVAVAVSSETVPSFEFEQESDRETRVRHPAAVVMPIPPIT